MQSNSMAPLTQIASQSTYRMPSFENKLSFAHMTPEFLNNLNLASRRSPDSQITPPFKTRFPLARICTRHQATCLLKNTPAGTNIPNPASTFPEQVHPSSRHVAEIQCRRTR